MYWVLGWLDREGRGAGSQTEARHRQQEGCGDRQGNACGSALAPMAGTYWLQQEDGILQVCVTPMAHIR